MPCSYYLNKNVFIKKFNNETKDINLELKKGVQHYKLFEPIYVREGSILMVTQIKGQIGMIDKEISDSNISDFYIEPFDQNQENKYLNKMDKMLKINCLIDNSYYIHEIDVTKKYYIIIPYDVRIKLAESTKNINIKLDLKQGKYHFLFNCIIDYFFRLFLEKKINYCTVHF